MNRFRKWLFKFVFGCDLVEYIDVLNQWDKTVKTTQEIVDSTTRLIDSNERTIALAKGVQNRCEGLLKRIEEMNANASRTDDV